jgi:catechol 2,3-dioxygenase-like lactoylglutathione lyase family enzyme
MKFIYTLIAVKNIDRSKQFYREVLGLEVMADFGANVTLTGGVALQTAETWKEFIHKQDEEILFRNNACELYFEEDDIDAFAVRLDHKKNIEYIHPLLEHPWGQRVVRFYDPDKHIIEVGENMVLVVKRFLDAGLSVEETAVRMNVPVEYVRNCSAQKG